MNIEKELFKRFKADKDKLLLYGFCLKNDEYTFSKNILDDSFKVDVTIESNGNVYGSIYDLSFGDEYTNFRVKEQQGEFVNSVRDEYKSILIDIRDNCFYGEYFVFPQSNRITKMIMEEFHDKPDFPWEKETFNKSGVFRNPNNNKWYGLIMDITGGQLSKSTNKEEVEIINLKLDSSLIKELVKKDGFYPAYHMNKTYWITIILDDSLSDEEIFKYIEMSHSYTTNTSEWIIPSNPNFFDVVGLFEKTDFVYWHQGSQNMNVGDYVYLYLAKPYSAIMYKCKITETNLPPDLSYSDKPQMRLELVEKYDKDAYGQDVLNECGIKSCRGPRHMPLKLSKIINKE